MIRRTLSSHMHGEPYGGILILGNLADLPRRMEAGSDPELHLILESEEADALPPYAQPHITFYFDKKSRTLKVTYAGAGIASGSRRLIIQPPQGFTGVIDGMSGLHHIKHSCSN